MADEVGVPALELSDEELERQGLQAHATRHWVFLHGTAEQFRTHTRRMLELEHEYLRRHPHRTWQGSGGSEPETSRDEVGSLPREVRIRDLIQTLTTGFAAVLNNTAAVAVPSTSVASEDAQSRVLAAFAAAPEGRLHKLEAHQVARSVAPNSRLIAALYKQDPPLLRVVGDQREITDAGRAWLVAHPAT
jgi:hypothetical protein